MDACSFCASIDDVVSMQRQQALTEELECVAAQFKAEALAFEQGHSCPDVAGERVSVLQEILASITNGLKDLHAPMEMMALDEVIATSLTVQQWQRD